MEAVVMPKRQKSDYALLWANGMTFAEVYDLMEEDIRSEYVTVLPALTFAEEMEAADKEIEAWSKYDSAHEGCCDADS
jgi:hypothetical protein